MREITPKNQMGFSWMENIFHPPFWWLFNASAEIHDINYQEGGTKEDRLNADTGFFWRMVQDANQLQYKQKKKAMRYAVVYYILVRCFGWIAFNKK